jgi:hypothetical protein
MNIKSKIETYLTKNAANPDKIEGFSKFVHDFFEHVEEGYNDIAVAFEEELEEYVYEIDEECAEAIISTLTRKDGVLSGKKWSLEETTMVAKQNDVAHKVEMCGRRHDCIKFWVAMNYVYAVHYNVNRTVNGYIELAIDELANRNFGFEELVKRIHKKTTI